MLQHWPILFFRQELKAESARREEESRLRDDDWRSALERVAKEVDAKGAHRASSSKKKSCRHEERKEALFL